METSSVFVGVVVSGGEPVRKDGTGDRWVKLRDWIDKDWSFLLLLLGGGCWVKGELEGGVL